MRIILYCYHIVKRLFNRHYSLFKDPLLVSLVQDVFKVISQTPGCLGPLQQRLVPTLVSIIGEQENKVELGLKVKTYLMIKCFEKINSDCIVRL